MTPLQFFKCLADETRLSILMLIQQEGELCVCELTEALSEIQPKISRHLSQLKQCGILRDRRQGIWNFYSLNPDLPPWAVITLQQTTEQNIHLLEKPLMKLNNMGDRPERAEIRCPQPR
ncbi:metalloregulator ArsR/SmtB family transcription factor [Luteithermobacter gelatinilyticus]|uniref:metalloregulator ArsR/SmtB family transcription factor n=1 Tax=Luteithermobacter gelatinilyticus TaxID=2582913 RepID=UPI0011060EB8|nr:metalloregulator ArsR/SmtB family transcription factor [Luteithermobacter gelatinilyticus]